MNKLLLLMVSVIALQGCSASLRDVQHATNAYNLYGNADIKEELAWKVRTWAGQ